MFDRCNVVEYYNKDPTVQRLIGLEHRIRALHQSADYKAALDLIRDGNDKNLESTLRENIISTIRREALNPPVQQRYYAEWDEERKAIRLMLPFPFDGLFDNFSLVGLSRWYANANRNITPILSEPGYGGYALFEINGIPNLSVANRTLTRMVNPPEFEDLNLRLFPALVLVYHGKYQNEPQDVALPENLNPLQRERYMAILKIVSDNFDRTGEGISPIDVWRETKDTNLGIPYRIVKRLMKRMNDEGLLQKRGSPPGVNYYPLRTAINSH